MPSMPDGVCMAGDASPAAQSGSQSALADSLPGAMFSLSTARAPDGRFQTTTPMAMLAASIAPTGSQLDPAFLAGGISVKHSLIAGQTDAEQSISLVIDRQSMIACRLRRNDSM